ncbi:DUF1127 domain-containing protein [Paenirhodobacter sp.]|uniref:DUF1127 domain-containing protein n=1 Tax=Paenirhodobacter sp. TaxID=1965326 RepID=UPI003B413691
MSSLSLRRTSLQNHKGLLQVVLAWIEARRTRIALSHLDARLLDDIGITPDTARSEAGRSFWS